MRKFILLFVAAVALWPATSAAQTPLTGDVPTQGGFGLAVWGGGPVAELEVAAAARGCDLDAVWLTVGGQFVGHLIGAPAFVNAQFTTSVGPTIPPATPVVLVCRPGTVVPLPQPTPLPTGTPVMSLLLGANDFAPGVDVPFEACYDLGGRYNAARIFEGTAGFFEFQGTALTLAASDVVVYASPSAAQADLDQLRTNGIPLLVEQFALFAGVTPEEFTALLVDQQYVDLPGLADGGASFAFVYAGGVTYELTIARVGNVLLQASAAQETSSYTPVTQALTARQFARTETAVSHSIDISGCEPV